MVLARYQSSKLQVSRFGELMVCRTFHLSGTTVWRFSDMSAKSGTVGKPDLSRANEEKNNIKKGQTGREKPRTPRKMLTNQTHRSVLSRRLAMHKKR